MKKSIGIGLIIGVMLNGMLVGCGQTEKPKDKPIEVKKIEIPEPPPDDGTWGEQVGKGVPIKDDNGKVYGYIMKYRDKNTKKYVYVTVSTEVMNSMTIDQANYLN